ncbi:MAG: VWA domain-containing protein [Myxococcales bacterium FL481]|nr:MAG: VWA domain-containing protein [Myxococcales bacterium FL481]
MRIWLCAALACTFLTTSACHRCEDGDKTCDGDLGGDDSLSTDEPWTPGSDDATGSDPPGQGNCSAHGNFDWSAPPAVAWDAEQGSTRITAQFVPRDPSCSPLLDEQFVTRAHVNGIEDPEHGGAATGETIPVDLHLVLVLDASYSMVVRNAWEQMLAAATTTLQHAATIWEQRPGTLSFDVVWFNSFVFHSQGQWAVSDLNSLPPPSQDANAFTKLYSAVVVAKSLSEAAHAAGTATGPQDHHQIIVFTDGDDNHSYFPNGSGNAGTTATGAAYVEVALDTGVDIATTTDAVSQHSANLTTHVIALSGQIQQHDALESIAAAGSGRYLAQPREDALGELFSEVVQEFVSLQTVVVTTPLGSGQHEFELRYQGLGAPAWSGPGYFSRCVRFEAGPGAALLADHCE